MLPGSELACAFWELGSGPFGHLVPILANAARASWPGYSASLFFGIAH